MHVCAYMVHIIYAYNLFTQGATYASSGTEHYFQSFSPDASLDIFYETFYSWRKRLTSYLQARRREAEEEIDTDEEEVQQF